MILFVKKKFLPFKVNDIDIGGNLNWMIRINDSSNKTTVTWPSHIRFVKFLEYGSKSIRANKKIMTSCRFKPTNDGQQRIYLRLMNRQTWVLVFPEKHAMIEQPEDPPNLYIYTSETAVKKNKNVFVRRVKKTEFWNIPTRNAYQMSASRFKAMNQDSPNGIKGTCRYLFSGHENNSSDGWIECHNTGILKFFESPIPCMNLVNK